MLVLTRRMGEEIVIAGNIRVKVVALDGRRIRLGVVAPKAVCVDRAEVYEQRKQEDIEVDLPRRGAGAMRELEG